MSDFVHLHLHTEYSLLDGAVRISQALLHPLPENPDEKQFYPIVDALKARGMDAVAITDHGNMYGAHAFVSAMRKAKLKPIIGQEFYVADDMHAKTADVLKQRYHLILLAKNMKGYKNLMKLSSAAYVDGFYMKPRIDLDILKDHSEGLICCSACLMGKVPQLLLAGLYDEAREYAARMRDMFDKGDYYIELQDHGLADEKKILNSLVRLAKDIGVKTVATNDVHYIEKEDADTQDTMMCVNLQCKKTDFSAARFENDSFYMKTGEEMEELFSWCPEAVASTREIADKVDPDYFVVETGDHYIPIYTNPDMKGRDAREFLRDLAWEKIKDRYAVITDEIGSRLDYELGVIDQCGFNDYFLIVWDFVNAAKKKGIPVGPGRGSGVGSIVAYSIGITDVDPLRYNLLFERFLARERVSMPDFDIDFCFVRRPEIIDYVVEKYGKDNVAQIIAYSTMSAKAVVKDVARVFDVPYNDANNWVKEIPVGKVMLKQVLTEGEDNYSEDFRKLYDTNETARKVIDTALKLEGMPRQTSMHAAGVVICGDPIVDHVALSRNGQDITTQFDKSVVEAIGLLKMDFLGLKTLTDISEAIKLIKEDKGVDIDFHKLGYEDPKVFELIASGDCEAVFQLEGGGMKKFMSQLQPTNLEDVMAGISMYRPGPMQFIDLFLSGKKDPSSTTYAHPALKEVLDVTYGCIVYQEQVMQIAQKLAGYSFGGADIMRRAISKKKEHVLEQQRQIFINGGVLKGDATKKQIPGAVANGMDEKAANDLFDQIIKFAGYAFNKSHAAAYTVLTYQTAYLKLYYPIHYITAVVNNRISNADETQHYMNYLKRIGTKILPPDINRSQKHFSIEGNNVRYGLMGIKNVGEQAVEYVLNERKNGEYKDIRDLADRCSGQINKRMMESLIRGGAMDGFGKTRATLIASYERIMDAVANDKKNRIGGQMSLFDELIEDVEVSYTELKEYEKATLLSGEKEMLGMYVSGHPLDDYAGDLKQFDFDTSMLTVEELDEYGDSKMSVNMLLDGRSVRMGGIISTYEKKTTMRQQKFAVGRIEDFAGSVAFSMFPKNYERYGQLLDADTPLKIYGRVDLRDESEPKISVERLEIWENKGAKDKKPEGEAVYVLLHTSTEQRLVSGVISMFEGSSRCLAQISDGNGGRLMEFRTRVEICDELIRRLKNIVGEDGVKVK